MPKLPKIPKGNLRTLLSFAQGPGKARGEAPRGSITVAQATDIETASYRELHSVDVDYHSFLNNSHLAV